MSDRHGERRAPKDGERDLVERAMGDPSAFVSLTAQFYRAEVDRVSTWRTRLDQTTNWTVVVIAAILTWAFTSPDNPHYVLLIGMLAMFAFLFIEAQRYQEYDAWRARVLLLQRNFFADVYRPEGSEGRDWRERLSHELREPSLQLPLWKALGHRLHRVYFPVLTVVLAAWIVRITVFDAGSSWSRTADIAAIPGEVVVTVVAAGYLIASGLTIWSVTRATMREFDDDSVSDLRGNS